MPGFLNAEPLLARLPVFQLEQELTARQESEAKLSQAHKKNEEYEKKLAELETQVIWVTINQAQWQCGQESSDAHILVIFVFEVVRICSLFLSV